MSSKIILASGNRGKLKEFDHILKPLNFQVIPQSEYNISEVAETGLSFIENALIKARHAAKYCQPPALADDPGLVVPALNGEPGIYSARYAGEEATDQSNIEKLLNQLEGIADRQAYFYCALVYVRHELDPTPIIATGQFWGEISHQPQGEQGFGYDPVFYLKDYQATAAEIERDEKNQISHRAIASRALLKQLSSL